MAFAQGSRAGLSYVVESSYGVTPSGPSMIALPINTHSLNLSRDSVESAEIRSDRMIDVHRNGNYRNAGDIEVDFRADDFDAFLESAFFSTFSSEVLKGGTTLKSFTIEDRQLDIAQYRKFTGMVVNTFNLTIQPNAMVKAKFGMVGSNHSASGTSLDASPTASSGNDAFDSFSGDIEEGGGAVANITSVEINIDNGVAPTYVIGTPASPQLEYGRRRVSGTVQAYFENLTMLNKFINETESTLQVSMTDGVSGNTYTVLIPRLKYMGADVPLANEQSRIINMPFIGLYDSVETTDIKITKS